MSPDDVARNRNSLLQAMMIGATVNCLRIDGTMLRTPDDYAMGIELPEAARGAPTRGDPAEIEEEKYRHLRSSRIHRRRGTKA